MGVGCGSAGGYGARAGGTVAFVIGGRGGVVADGFGWCFLRAPAPCCLSRASSPAVARRACLSRIAGKWKSRW
eukprot:2268313-Prymnesium_polylepis.1